MEENPNTTSPTQFLDTVITPEILLTHWQGHRKLTRRVIEAFPEDKLFSYSIGGMRSFADMVTELLDIGAPGIRGITTGEWKPLNGHSTTAGSKKEILQLWDEATEEINKYWSQVTPSRFQEVVVAFGQYEDKVYSTILYFIDNEIHHRGQGYVYLRSLGIAPPNFWER